MLKQRIITAVILLIVSVWALFFTSANVWHGLLLAVGFIAAWEWAGFARIDSHALKISYAMIVTLLANFSFLAFDYQWFVYALVLQLVLVVAIVLRYQFTKGQKAMSSMLLLLMAGALVIVPFITAMTLFREEFGALALLLSMTLVWLLDTGAYFSGRKFGKHKLAIYVSPGKTWQGVYGGALLSFVAALLIVFWWQPAIAINGWVFALLLTLIAAYSVFGDLFESVLKRQVAMKDSGSILPGHGGVLDRIDSLLVALPLFYVLWYQAQSL